MKRIIPLCLLLAVLAGAYLSDLANGRQPVERLDFEAMGFIVRDCNSSGRLASDDYCKQVTTAYEQQRYQRAEQQRLEKVRARALSMDTTGELPEF